jgi:hypothetical protein
MALSHHSAGKDFYANKIIALHITPVQVFIGHPWAVQQKGRAE